MDFKYHQDIRKTLELSESPSALVAITYSSFSINYRAVDCMYIFRFHQVNLDMLS